MNTQTTSSSAHTQQSNHDGIIPTPPQGPSETGSTPLIGAPSESALPDAENDDLANDDTGAGEVTGIRKRKLKSEAWNHFKRLKENGAWMADCNHCRKKLSAHSKNGTNHLLEHIKRCPIKNKGSSDIRQCLLTTSKGTDGRTQLQNHTFDAELARLHLAYMIIMHEYPLRMVEHKGFRMFLNTIQPLFKPISRNTLRSDIMKIFTEEKTKIMNLLESNRSRIAITTDMWTSSNQKKGYMAITAHYIDNSWSLQSRIVRFLYVPCPHTAQTICDALFDCLMDWNIDSKLSTLTLDNCSTNDSMVSLLTTMLNKFSPDSLLLGGEFLQMRCAAHILNLIVKDGMDVLGDSIDRIRDSVYYWTATPKRVEKFEETARQLHVRSTKKLAHDVKTRWNSTYFMLSTALAYKSVFPRLKQREPSYKTVPTDHDWLLAGEICEKLEFFYEMTKTFSATKHPTANTIFMFICDIRIKMNSWLDSQYSNIREMARCMIAKYNKYWEDVHVIFSIAVILDPRFKFRLIDFYYDPFYGENAKTEKDKIQKTMYEFEKLYKEASSKEKSSNFASGSKSSSSVSSGARKLFGGIESFEAYLSEVTTVTLEKSEFDSYLEEPLLPRDEDFDILTWWKTQGVKYRTLRSIERDIYAIPVSSVASEAAFSTSGRIVNKHRSRLIPETLEALMCSQDWLWERYDETTKSSEPQPRVANGATAYASDDDEEQEYS